MTQFWKIIWGGIFIFQTGSRPYGVHVPDAPDGEQFTPPLGRTLDAGQEPNKWVATAGRGGGSEAGLGQSP